MADRVHGGYVGEKMVDYTYPRPQPEMNSSQLRAEVIDALAKDCSIRIDPMNVTVGFDAPLSGPEQAVLASTVANHVIDPDYLIKRNPWRGVSWAIVHAVAPNLVTLRRTIGGVVYTRSTNIVSRDVVLAYKAGDLNPGDRVFVAFDENNLAVLSKVVVL